MRQSLHKTGQMTARLYHSKTLWQLVRYGAVGVMNTLLTLIVIYVFKSLLGINLWISNASGYIAGFINSFFLNKRWVFKSDRHFFRESILFVVGFLICYGLQFLATWLLTYRTPLSDAEWTIAGFTFSGYAVATLAGMVVYTIANFIYNRSVTFKA